MDLAELFEHQRAMSQAFDTRVSELHSRTLRPSEVSTSLLSASDLLDQGLQEQWGRLKQKVVHAHPEPQSKFTGRSRQSHIRTEEDDVVDVAWHEVPKTS